MVLGLSDSWSNWNLKMLVFKERGKPEYPKKNLWEQSREPTTNPNNPHIASTPGFELRPHRLEAASALTTAPSLPLPWNVDRFLTCPKLNKEIFQKVVLECQIGGILWWTSIGKGKWIRYEFIEVKRAGKGDLLISPRVREVPGSTPGQAPTCCWFSHVVTKIQSTKLSILPRFYLTMY